MPHDRFAGSAPTAKPTTAYDELRAFIAERRMAKAAVTNFESFVRQATQRFAATEVELMAEESARLDVGVAALHMDGILTVVSCAPRRRA